MIRRNMKICLVTLSFFFGGATNTLFALENGNLPTNEEIMIARDVMRIGNIK